MPTRKSKIEQPPAASESLPLNDPPGKPLRNAFPKAPPIDPRALGAIGVRIMTERALGACHGYGEEVWKLHGIGKAELAQRKAEIVAALRSIVADPERSNYVNRGGAVALLGELAGQAALADLEAVLDSPFERRSTRAWAAFAIGRGARAKGLEALQRHLTNPDPLIRRKVIDGLAASRSREALTLLRDILKQDKDPFVANRAFAAIRRLEQNLKLNPLPVQPRPVPKSGGTTTAVSVPR